jgi:hypothetical protein
MARICSGLQGAAGADAVAEESERRSAQSAAIDSQARGCQDRGRQSATHVGRPESVGGDRRDRKYVIDQVAAVVILRGWMDGVPGAGSCVGKATSAQAELC